MKIQLSSYFHRKIKKEDVRIQKSFKEALRLFILNPFDPQLDNHPLKDPWNGCRSIDITGDYRAIYEELNKGDDVIAYFITIGTHQELYAKDN
jgi:addiction module RelE/StbE family toxin